MGVEIRAVLAAAMILFVLGYSSAIEAAKRV